MGSKDHSFDVVSEVNFQEVDNAIQQAKKELAQRFDFKGSTSTIELNKEEKKIILKAENEFRMKTLVDLVETKFAKRNVSLKSMQFDKLETGMIGGSVKQTISIQNGIPQDKAKDISKFIRDTKLKVQAQIQGEQLRVQAPKIDDLQTVMGALRKHDFGIDLQFVNLR